MGLNPDFIMPIGQAWLRALPGPRSSGPLRGGRNKHTESGSAAGAGPHPPVLRAASLLLLCSVRYEGADDASSGVLSRAITILEFIGRK